MFDIEAEDKILIKLFRGVRGHAPPGIFYIWVF